MNNTMKAMICQPMAGMTEREIMDARIRATSVLESLGYEVVNTFFAEEVRSTGTLNENGVVHIPLFFLAKSLEKMSSCNVAYFCKGWENARGCKIEHDAACNYGLSVMYE